MVNIDTVYQKVLAIANKEQRGYVTPQEFNLFADQAQMDIFEQYFYDINQFKKLPGNLTEYSDVVDMLEEKIAALNDQKEAIRRELLTPEFHIKRISEVIESVIPQIHELDLDEESLKQEFEGILNQVPGVVQDTWSSQISLMREIDSTITKHSEMMQLYLDWQKEQEEQEAAKQREQEEQEAAKRKAEEKEEELLKKISSGDIEEPSRTTGRKRSPGKRPPVTLSKYRRLTSDSKDEGQQG